MMKKIGVGAVALAGKLQGHGRPDASELPP